MDVNGLETTFTSEVVLSSYFIFESFKPYPLAKHILCKFNVSHDLDTSNIIAAYGQVEDVIVAPTPPVLEPVTTNASFTYTLDSHVGTNVTYRWDYGNGDILWSNGTFNQLTMDYTYDQFGNYTIEVFMWNQVSNATITFPITIMAVSYTHLTLPTKRIV